MASREDYETYLDVAGYSEEEVLAMLNPSDQNEQDHIATAQTIALMAQLLNEGKDQNSEYALNVMKSLTANTNHLLETIIDARLKKRFGETSIEHFKGVFAGVFPTNDFNARTIPKYPGLVLIDTACFELIEAFVWVSMWDASYEERAIKIGDIARKLFNDRSLPTKLELDHPSLRGEGTAGTKAWINDFVTAAEEFILAHEYGHLTLGHLDRAPNCSAEERCRMELEADVWAFDSLLRPNSCWGMSERETRLGFQGQIGGVCAALGIAHFMEQVCPLPSDGSYPTARQRLNVFMNLVRENGIDEMCNRGLPMLDQATAVAIYLARGPDGFQPPSDADEFASWKRLVLWTN